MSERQIAKTKQRLSACLGCYSSCALFLSIALSFHLHWDRTIIFCLCAENGSIISECTAQSFYIDFTLTLTMYIKIKQSDKGVRYSFSFDDIIKFITHWTVVRCKHNLNHI